MYVCQPFFLTFSFLCPPHFILRFKNICYFHLNEYIVIAATKLSFDLKTITVMSDQENTMSCYDWRNMSKKYLFSLPRDQQIAIAMILRLVPTSNKMMMLKPRLERRHIILRASPQTSITFLLFFHILHPNICFPFFLFPDFPSSLSLLPRFTLPPFSFQKEKVTQGY